MENISKRNHHASRIFKFFFSRQKKCTGKTACCFSARKRLLGRVSRPIYWASVYNQYTVTEHSLYLRPSLTKLEHGQQTALAQQGAGVTGTVESGRPPTGGPVRSDLKEPRSSWWHEYLKNFLRLNN